MEANERDPQNGTAGSGFGSAQPLDLQWADSFWSHVRSRLEAGETQYHGKSHKRPAESLIDEIQQELEDVSGWSAILWAKLDRLRAALDEGSRSA